MDTDELWPAEAARELGVNVRTLTRWADAGRIQYIRLPSGQRRYRRAAVDAARVVVEPTHLDTDRGVED